MKKSVFIFRRDLRLDDNTGLINACKNSNEVLPIFIFTPEQINPLINKYFSNNSVQFLVESLDDLNIELKKLKSRLFIFYGDYSDILKKIKKEYDYDSIYVNEDYTPYSIKRDNKIKLLCDEMNVSFNSYHDITLLKMSQGLNDDNQQYKVFTPFYKNALRFPVNKPDTYKCKKFVNSSLKISNEYQNDIHQFYKKNKNILVNGGRKNGLIKLKSLVNFKKYGINRDFPYVNTTHISAMNKYGCISIREVYWKIKSLKIEPLLRQLYWRDFYYRISYYYPWVLQGKSFKKNYDKIKWKTNKKFLEKWKEGKTGYPMVDAGMRQMNTTGWMHNRLRMIVSNFLIKDLFIDWREGERYFAKTLYDYDPSQNNGGWQWSSGSGTDAQPFFRTFNPWLQSEKYDKECEYIKKWVPELRNIPNKHIHKWYDYHKNHDVNYPAPIVDHKYAVQKTLSKYKEYLN